jgi:hypothetical protein
MNQRERTLSQFGETWARQMQRGAGQAPAAVGWCLWAALAGIAVLVALVEILNTSA